MEAELLSKIVGLLFYLCRKHGGEVEDIDRFASAVGKCMMPASWIGQTTEKHSEKLTAEQLKARFTEVQKAAEKAFG